MSIQYMAQDLNPRPFEHELSPITTRPGLPPYNIQKKIVPSPFPGFELLLCLMSHPCLGTEHRHKQLLFSLSRLSGRSYRLNRYCCGNIFTFRYLWFPYRSAILNGTTFLRAKRGKETTSCLQNTVDRTCS